MMHIKRNIIFSISIVVGFEDVFRKTADFLSLVDFSTSQKCHFCAFTFLTAKQAKPRPLVVCPPY